MLATAPGGRGPRETFDLNSTTKTLFRFFDEHLHGFFRNGTALAARERCVCLVQHRQDFEASALALFPQRQRFSHRLSIRIHPGAAVEVEGMRSDSRELAGGEHV